MIKSEKYYYHEETEMLDLHVKFARNGSDGNIWEICRQKKEIWILQVSQYWNG